MRNLKKVLALVLAMAIALTMFAGALDTVAKPTDYDSLSASAQEAVSVLSALGVINGYPDGTFKGDAVVTRAELAKMIYVMKTGDTSAAAGFYANADLSKVFKDSVDAWAVPYINYCYLNSIIVGYEDGTVRANNPVSGVEAAKIALVALGYAPKTEGLEGSGFYTNTMRLSSVAGLLKNVGGNMAEGMSRADTATLLYNALYANTVYYVGGAATAKTGSLSSTDTITLGEEGFDLLDVSGVLVANDQIGISAYWRDVLKQDTYYNNAFSTNLDYKQYEKASADQSRFVYKDYVAASAANPQGYYIDKVVTVNVDTKFADLGHQFRLLITNASNSYSSTEVRKLYGIVGETANSSNYKATATTVAKQAEDILRKMYYRYLLKNTLFFPTTDTDTDAFKAATAAAEAIDGTVFVNGKAASYKTAYASLAKASTAPVSFIDNDNDGTVDSLFIADYTLGTVNAVTDTTVTILGPGAGIIKNEKLVLTNGNVAKDDYVAWYKNDAEGIYYVKKLTAVNASITGYDGSKYTINGTAYATGALLSTADGSFLNGYNSVNSAIFGFWMDEDADNKYIAKINATSDTKFQKYAIIADTEIGSPIYGRPQIKIYTEDNAYVYGNVASINGMQVYDSATYEAAKNAANDGHLNYHQYGSHEEFRENCLISYIQNGDDLYIYTAGYNDAVGLDIYYDAMSDSWIDDNTNSGRINKNENGVVFVTYMQHSRYDEAYIWRAYGPGEFTVPYGSDEASVADDHEDTLIYAWSNAVDVAYIEAAAIEFDYDHTNYTLPGLPTREGQSVIATITAQVGATYDPATSTYAYTYTALNPWATDTTSYTTVPMVGALSPLHKGYIYKLYLDSEGKIERYETLYDGDIRHDPGSTIELDGYYARSFYIGLNGQIQITLYNRYTNEPMTLLLGTDSNVFFVKNLGTSDIAAVDWTKMAGGNMQLPSNVVYGVVVDYNEQTGVVNNMWIDTTGYTPPTIG